MVAATARQKAAEFRDGIDTTGTVRGFMRPDPKVLQLIDITLPPGVLDAPGAAGCGADASANVTNSMTSRNRWTRQRRVKRQPAPGTDVVADPADVAAVEDTGDVLGEEAITVCRR